MLRFEIVSQTQKLAPVYGEDNEYPVRYSHPPALAPIDIQSTRKMFVCGCEKFVPALA